MPRGKGAAEVSVVLIYDIEKDGLRTRVSDVCLDYGLERIQFSAFFGRLNRNRRQELALRLRNELGEESGRLRIIPVCEQDLKDMWVLDQYRRDADQLKAEAEAREAQKPRLRVWGWRKTNDVARDRSQAMGLLSTGGVLPERMPGTGKQTYKMREGKAAQAIIEQLETRRTLREYGLADAVRRFDVWVESAEAGLTGKIDLLLEMPAEAAPVEFKLTSGEVGRNHRMQLAGYALLVESAMGKPVKQGFVYRIPDGRVFPVAMDGFLKEEAREAIRAIKETIETGWLPEATDVRKRCEECEYANYCGDVW